MTKDSYVVGRAQRINALPADVYAYIADFHRWTAWSPWEQLDPALRRTYSGAASGSGAVYRWSGNRKAGAGSMSIVEAVEPSKVSIDVAFEKPFRAQSRTVFTVEPEGSGSLVTWTMAGERTFMIRVMSFVKPMDALIGPDFEKGLAQLKAVAEQAAG